MKNKRSQVITYKKIKKNFFVLYNKIVVPRNVIKSYETSVEGKSIKDTCTTDDEYCAYYKRMTRWQTV
ncbi:MAG: hypothetical protein GXO81_02470 [Chlorobi bacterium]|nr:hypothetical protein [Chlorobiota bacterium]